MRFPEFTGEWMKCKFGEIATGFDYGMNAAAKPYDGQNKYIRITDIDEVSSTYNNSSIVSPDGILSENYVVNEGDILLARTGASTGKSYLYRKSDGKLYYAGFLIRANVAEHNPYFVFSQLHTHRYWRWVSIMSARSGQPGINSLEYASFPIFTTTLKEENKISSLLSLIDKRIATQNKIIEKLESLIKGIADKLFQTARETKLLLELAPNITSGTDKNGSGTIPLYGSTGIIGKVKNASQKGNIVLVARVGTIGTVQYVKESCGVSDNALIVEAGEMTKYIYHFLKTYKFAHITSGTTQPLITASSLKKIAVPTYDIERQTQIVLCLNILERKLDIEKQYLSDIAMMKQYLLHQMFI